jgi:hypothetical protein
MASSCRVASRLPRSRAALSAKAQGVVFGRGHVDVHASRYQCRNELRAPRSGVRRERRAEGEPGDECLATESVAKQLQQRHRVVDHSRHADFEPVRVRAQRW